MTGCCGQGPVIVSGGTAATPRVDVEAVLLCDVLPDGTVAASILEERTYDTANGAATGTRYVTLDGNLYTPVGTLGPCPASDGCARQVTQTVRCDDTDGDGTGDVTYVELWSVDPCSGGAPVLLGAYRDGDLTAPYTPVAPVPCGAEECPTCVEHVLCDVQPEAAVIGPMPPNPINGGTLPNGVDWRATSPDTLLFANDRWRADASPAVFTFSQPVLLDWAAAFSGPGTTTVYVPPGNEVVSIAAGHAWDPATRRLSATAATVDSNEVSTFRARDVSSWTAPALVGAIGGAFAYYGDMTVTVDVAHPFLRRICRDCAGAVVSLTDTELDGTTPYAPAGTVGVCAPVTGEEQRWDGEVLELCDTAADGTTTAFLRHLRYGTLDGVVYGRRDTTLDGVTAYTPTGTVGRCPTTTDCASPTTPTATVGLCLADGTPIAVTVVRDCAGTVTQEGWINLSTGAFSAGAPPAGVMACGDSQSVQVSGTFCDVDPATGDVLGLVLIEYSYAADGTISGVRLVDAVTGATYTPAGTVTTCPAGVEQPDQDVVQLCDVQADGTRVPMIRDYRRDETGAVVGHSDYTLDGAAYVPTGTVDLCQPAAAECGDTEILVLCDVQPDGSVMTFLRRITYDCGGAVTGQADTTLDGTAYTPLGTVGTCDPSNSVDVETWPLCILNTDGSVMQHVRAEQVYDANGTAAGLPRLVDAVTGLPVAIPGGATIGVCPGPETCARQIVERCGCDDTTGDGLGDVQYTELWAVDPCNGEPPVLLGTYLDGDLTQPYTPVAPVECTAAEMLPGPLLTGVRAVTGTTPQDLAAAFPGLQSVSLTVTAGTVNVTMSDGTAVPIPAGVTMTWSVAQEADTALAAASFTGATAATSYLLNWTHK